MATQTQRAVNIGSTATSVKSTAEFFAEFDKIDYRELVSYISDHVGDRVVVRGRVFNVVDGGFQAYFAGTYEAFVVLVPDSSVAPDRIYKNNVVTIYGIVMGTFEGTNAYGGKISQPEILAEYIKKG